MLKKNIIVNVVKLYQVILLFGVGIFLVGNTVQAQSGKQLSGGEYPSITSDGSWVWFTDPRAVYYEGEHKRTYSGWIDSYGDVLVGYYDHETGETKTHVLYDDFQADDHNNPAIMISTEGHIMAFYARHGWKLPMLLSKSVNPENITEWEKPQPLDLNDTTRYEGFSDTYTYANPFYLSSEDKIYLFWRGSDFKPNYSVSSDGGKTWTMSRIIILPEREYPNRRPYVKYSSNGKDRIDIVFTDGHPRNEPDNSVYYMYYKDGALYRANGQKIKNIEDGPVHPRETDVIYDAKIEGNSKAWTWDVAEDEDGNPVVTYAKFPGGDNKTHVYCYARWDGEKWQNHELLDSGRWFPQTPKGRGEREPNYSGGVVIDQENPNIVYLSRQVNDIFEIEEWTTSDKGDSWEKRQITHNSKYDNVRPVAVRNAQEGNPNQVMWMSNTHYSFYQTYMTSIKLSIQPQEFDNPLKQKNVVKLMKRVANWQLENPLHYELEWHYGTLYAGLWALYEISGDAHYKNKIHNVGQVNNWQLMNDVFHADRITVAQSFMNIYEDGEAEDKILNHMKWVADMHVQRNAPADVTFKDNPYRFEWWSWIDALFMAPPFFAQMHDVTGDKKYLDYMNERWWLTFNYLYDEEESLLYRDDSYIDKRTKNGKKVFWSRGNGWVMGGLVRVLKHIPEDYSERPDYIDVFKKMAFKVASLQGDDGLWRVSLLDQQEFPEGESSGTALFTYALAWGINNDILPADKFKPIVKKAWIALAANVNSDGRVGYVQQPAGSPTSFEKDDFQVYGAGVFLLAGSEVYKLLE